MDKTDPQSPKNEQSQAPQAKKPISKTTKIAGIVLIVLILFATIGMYKIGFFGEVIVKEVLSPQKIVLGKAYEGFTKEPEFRDLFLQVGKLKMDKVVKGEPCGIYFNNPENKQGKVNAVIGLLVSDSTSVPTLPAGFKYYVLPERKTLRGSMEANDAVVTTRCYPAIYDYCEANKITPTNHFFEVFSDSSQTFVEMAL